MSVASDGVSPAKLRFLAREMRRVELDGGFRIRRVQMHVMEVRLARRWSRQCQEREKRHECFHDRGREGKGPVRKTGPTMT